MKLINTGLPLSDVSETVFPFWSIRLIRGRYATFSPFRTAPLSPRHSASLPDAPLPGTATRRTTVIATTTAIEMPHIFAGAFSSFFHGLIDLFLLALNFRLARLIVNATGEWHFSATCSP